MAVSWKGHGSDFGTSNTENVGMLREINPSHNNLLPFRHPFAENRCKSLINVVSAQCS